MCYLVLLQLINLTKSIVEPIIQFTVQTQIQSFCKKSPLTMIFSEPYLITILRAISEKEFMVQLEQKIDF